MTTMLEGRTPQLGVAIIGGRFMAEVHARAARSAGGKIVGVLSSSAASSQRSAIELGIDTFYSSIEELLQDPAVEVVHVCTPNTTHEYYTRLALEAGKHVVCEKPLATSLDVATDLTDLARRAGVVAAIPFIYRYHPMVREARDRIATGISGRVFSIQGAYLQDWLASPTDDDWRVNVESGGASRAFADIGSHLCDVVEFVTGERITRLSSRIRTVHADRAVNKDVETEDVVTAVFDTDSGAVGTLHISQVAQGHKNRLTFEIDCESESLTFDQENPDDLLLGTKDGFRTQKRSANLSKDAARLSFLPPGHGQGYQDAFNGFVADVYAAIRGEEIDGLPGFADGQRAAALTQSVLESHASGRWVTVPERSSDVALQIN